MDTSDSEHFESADEDILSDHEDSSYKNKNQEIVRETRTLTLEDVTQEKDTVGSVNQVQTIDTKNSPTSTNVETEDTHENNSKKHATVCKGKTKTKLGTKLNQKVKKDSSSVTTQNDTDTKKFEASEPNKDGKNRPEFGEPPSRVECWEDNVNLPFEKNNENSSLTKPKRPEFGIPPARPTCWFPEVNVPTYNETLCEKKLDNTANFDKIESDLRDGKSNEDEVNMWEDDDWEPITDESSRTEHHIPNSEKSAQSNDSGWGGWGNWGGVTSFLSTATMGVSTITSHVTQGLSTVIESGIGVPDPEELARINKAEKEKNHEVMQESDFPDSKTEKEPKPSTNLPHLGFGLNNFVSSVSQITKLVETTGNKVFYGGLDTLETIGKKTMEVLQDGDPGLKKKRAFLKIEQDKPVLSQLLREAKEKAEQENKLLEQKHYAKRANYETLFDDHQGLVHLEALEMLSKQCDLKLQSLIESYSEDALTDMQETMAQVKELCELPEEDEEENFTTEDIKDKLFAAVSEINISIKYDKLISTWSETEAWLENLNTNICNEKELHEQAIETLAQLTAVAVEQFHKTGELLLVKEHRSTADEADSLVQLTTMLMCLIGNVATKFSNKLSLFASGARKDDVNSLITNVYFEAANSSSYIKVAFQLLMPVLQVGAV